MQTSTSQPSTIPQHILDRLENEWRQIRQGKEKPRPSPVRIQQA